MTRQQIAGASRLRKRKEKLRSGNSSNDGNNNNNNVMTLWSALQLGSLSRLLVVCCFILSLLSFRGRFLEEQIVSPSSLSSADLSLLPSTSKTATLATIRTQPRLRRDKHPNQEDTASYFTKILATENTTILAQGPYQAMQSFLREYPDTTGSRFIRHLQQQLHGRPEWEPRRQSVCERTLPLCIGGYHNTISKTSSISTSPRYSTSLDRIYNFYSTQENDMCFPLLPRDKNSTSVYRIRRYRETDHVLSNLGTHKVCLPLMLAAASMDYDTGIVIELGPFMGFSSKCAAYGILAAATAASSRTNSTIPRSNSVSATALPRLISFDTFEGEVNYKAITKNAPWVKEVYSNFEHDNSNFVHLWQDTVQYTYPQAQAIQGKIDKTVLNDSLLKERYSPLSPQVLIVDTVKTSKLLHNHLGGLTLRAGTVLFLMDFQRSKDVVQQIYGCFRQEYFLPVYISWNDEHMAFVVTKTFQVNDPAIFQCYQQLSVVDFEKNPYHKKVMEARIKQDLVFLSGLTMDANVHERFREGLRDKTMQAMFKIVDNQDEWTWRVLAGSDSAMETSRKHQQRK